MNSTVKHFFRKHSELDRKSSKRLNIQFGDNTLLVGSITTLGFALIGVAGFVWDEARPLRGCALVFAMFFAPTFLAISIKELTRHGLGWKRIASLIASTIAAALVGLAFYEVLSTHPILKHS